MTAERRREAQGGVTVSPWPESASPDEGRLERALRDEGLVPRWWSSRPGDRFAEHRHAAHKVLYCARGGIRFTIEPAGERLDLRPGDRLDLPAGVAHTAVTGPRGVTCVEAFRE